MLQGNSDIAFSQRTIWSAMGSQSDIEIMEEDSIPSPTSPAHRPQWSMGSASSLEEEDLHSPQTTSPPIQTMESPSTFDPHRIPASAFGKPANTSEWSMASNDSLFSIHTGALASPSPCVMEAKSHELCTLPPLMEEPPIEEKPSNVSASDKEKEQEQEDDDDDDPVEMKKTGASASMPRLSSESGHSTTSFAFPVLESGGRRGSSLGRVVEEEKPHQQTHTTQDYSTNTTTTRWFSCFSCCASCC